uniref:KH domain-containing protein n=1 Tax=Caenorhabditis japonica TaxID=281687 RepID=A0A8R1DJ04_CAEJA
MFLRQRSLNKKPNNLMNKTVQLRHEMIIRNSDSGKIMGVKGRRVAAVEQLTNTVISFQKVDAKSKERTLTITASTMEDIERAKDMIIDTIRRNMSPIRVSFCDDSTTYSQKFSHPHLQSDMSVPPPTTIPTEAPAQNNAEEEEDVDDEEDIKLEQTADGKLTFHCDDPELLAAAQEALSAYLRVRARPSAEEREEKKARRKSMPLQQSAHGRQEPVMKPAKTFHGSTPNLADGLAATTTVVVASAVPEVQQKQQEHSFDDVSCDIKT